MNLTDLGLNRYLYKDDLDSTPDSSLVSGDNIQNFAGGGGGNGVEPGDIITSVILQSSPSDDRIEINPDDTFKAYNSGNVVVLIDKNGIVADNLTVQNETIVNSEIENLIAENAEIDTADIQTANIDEANIDNAFIDVLEVFTSFTYAGYKQPQVFGGEVDGAGNAVSLPPTWLSLRISDGLYIIVHGLNNTDYQVVATPTEHHIRPMAYSFLADSFLIEFQQTVYGSDTFPVSGGGGGSVTVDGVRIAPNEELADTGFCFVLTNNLP